MNTERNQQSEQKDYFNESKFMTDDQKAKWEKLASIHRALSSINIETNNTQIKNSKLRLDDLLSRSKYLVDSKQKYNVVFLGASGQGKSTILNVLSGRDLLPVGGQSAVTGTIINIEAKDDNEPERVIVHYSEPIELKNQIKELAELGNIGNLDKLLEIFDHPEISEDELSKITNVWFNSLKKFHLKADPEQKKYVAAIWDIVNSYKMHNKSLRNKKLSDEYLIPEDLNELSNLINEQKNYYNDSSLDDQQNQLVDRKIRLISYVTYRIDASENKSRNMGKLLRNNICIVDVPGFGNKNPVHEIITKNYIRDKEPLFALVIYTEPRIADNATMDMLDWINKNYIVLARENPELLRTVSECIFLVVNNGTNVIDEDTIKTINQEIKAQISKYISKDYLHQFKDRGQDANPYILVTPLPAAYLNNQTNNEKESKIKNCYDMFSASLNIGSDIDNNKKQEFILDSTGIPLLTDQILSFLKDRRINVQIDRAYDYLKLGLNELGNSIKTAVGNYEYYDSNIRAKKALDEKNVEFQNQLIGTRDRFFVIFGKENESVQPFVKVFNNSINKAKTDLKELVNNFDISKNITSVIQPIYGREVIQTTLADLGNDIDFAIQQRFRTYAENCADELLMYFDSVLKDSEIKAKMTDATYGKKYFRKISTEQLSIWEDYIVNEIEEEYEFHVKAFKKDYTEAFRILMIYELLRDEKRSAFSQLTAPVRINSSGKDEASTVITDQVRSVIKNVEEILDNTSENPLFKGLRKHFFYLYVRLKDNLQLAYSRVIDQQQIALSTDPDLVEKILKINSKYENDLEHLSEIFEKIKQLHGELLAVTPNVR